MKFAGGFAVLMASCLPLASACGSPENPNFFSERGGARDPGSAGMENVQAGSSEGGTASGGTGSQEGGTGNNNGSVGGHPGTSSGGKNGAAGRGGNNGAGGASATAGAGGANGGSGGKPTTGSSGTGGGASSTAGSGGAGSGGGASGSGGVSGVSGASGSSGWSGWGGWNNGWGGWNGWSGASSGGAAGASPCPVNPPTKNEICDVTTPDSCFYAGQACSCLSTLSGPGPGPINPTKKWACYGDGGLCPDTKPVAGASCKGSVDVECPYPGNDYCVCSGNAAEAHWVCQANPPTCAANKPLMDTCSSVKTCSWGSNREQACFCNGTRWGCEGGF